MAILEVCDLSIEYQTREGAVQAANDINFEVDAGETLGVLGESGCGKTTVVKSLLQILPANGEIVGGEVIFNGNDLLKMSETELNERIRWKEISWIGQNAMHALNPVLKIKKVFRENISTHTDLSKAEIDERTKQLLREVNLNPEYRNKYPHELSGGQRQRVNIALALALDPQLIIADEPTTGLDVIIQDDILDLIKQLQEDRGNSMMFVNHDVSAVAEIAEKTVVMYAGQVVESGPTSNVFHRSTHPYTIGLLNAYPTIGSEDELINIPGTPPELIGDLTGCSFRDRCPFSTDTCETDPPLVSIEEGHEARCHYTDEADQFREDGADPDTWDRKPELVK